MSVSFFDFWLSDASHAYGRDTTQGDKVTQLWPDLFERYGLEVSFAHRTFACGSDPMPESESKTGSAVQHKMLWRGLQFLPERPLRCRKNIEFWRESH